MRELVFQSTRPRGRTRRLSLCRSMIFVVSIHASSREDATFAPVDAYYDTVFQSTRPRGRTRPGSRKYRVKTGSFNPRVLAGGRDPRRDGAPHPAPSFNPRVLAGGRDLLYSISDATLAVSIHASSREDATLAHGVTVPLTVVSIHASSREDATRGH